MRVLLYLCEGWWAEFNKETAVREKLFLNLVVFVWRLWRQMWLTLTSDGSQPGHDPGAGRRGGALAPLGLPLVHAGRRLHRDLVLEACKERNMRYI